jgi:hypothetical protein
MSAMGICTNAMARAMVDSLLSALGGGPLVLTFPGENQDGTRSELGYEVTLPELVEVTAAHGRQLAVDEGEGWEIIVPADDLEELMHGRQFADVQSLMQSCESMRFANTQLTLKEVQSVCAGGEAYLYRLLAKETD